MDTVEVLPGQGVFATTLRQGIPAPADRGHRPNACCSESRSGNPAVFIQNLNSCLHVYIYIIYFSACPWAWARWRRQGVQAPRLHLPWKPPPANLLRQTTRASGWQWPCLEHPTTTAAPARAVLIAADWSTMHSGKPGYVYPEPRAHNCATQNRYRCRSFFPATCCFSVSIPAGYPMSAFMSGMTGLSMPRREADGCPMIHCRTASGSTGWLQQGATTESYPAR